MNDFRQSEARAEAIQQQLDRGKILWARDGESPEAVVLRVGVGRMSGNLQVLVAGDQFRFVPTEVFDAFGERY